MKARITRKHKPKRVFLKTTYRQAWDSLALDFENRCAYSMQHLQHAGGRKCMEVDHFNPRRKKDDIQEYENLFLATRHCNGAKRDRWPSLKDQKDRIRFLNCCKEVDYGVHIFEDPDSHEVVGVTPEGRYHVRNCDLNAQHLVDERKARFEYWRLIESKPMSIKKGFSLPADFDALVKVVSTMIPKIALLSGVELAKHRATKRAVADHSTL